MGDKPKRTLDIASVRPLNGPVTVTVREDSSGAPVGIGKRGCETTLTVEDKWRIDDEWWRREPISRMYYLVRLSSGNRLTIYKDLIKGIWYRQRG